MYKLHLCVGKFTTPLNRWSTKYRVGKTMDNELQTYTDQIMDQQQYRSGIFSSVLSPIVKAMAAFRYSANERGAYSSRRDY